jgi:hypothetical protein
MTDAERPAASAASFLAARAKVLLTGFISWIAARTVILAAADGCSLT